MNEVLTKISYFFAAVLTSLSVVSPNTLALFIGVLLGVMTFVINWVYKHKTYKLHEKYAKMQNKIDLERAPHIP
jgi:uncharacterized membrane protein (DUF485 family)